MIGCSIGSVIDRLARNFHDAEAISMMEDQTSYTYDEYFKEVRRVGRALLNLGLQEGDRVAIICGDRPEVISTYYGAMWAGLTTVPLNPGLSLEDHAYVLKNTGSRAVLYDDSTAERIVQLRQTVDIEHPISAQVDAVFDGAHLFSDLTARASDSFGAPTLSSLEAPALIIHTGGTTGQPKGATHTHRSLLAGLYSAAFEFDLQSGDRFFHVAPLAHAGGIMFLPVWMKGGTNCLMGGFNPPQLLKDIEHYRPTSILLVPTMIYMLLDTPGIGDRDVTSLRTILYGGSPMAYERLSQALDLFGPVFLQLYGQAEAVGQISVLTRDAHVRALEGGDEAVLRSCGRSVLIADVMVADDDLNPVAAGAVGEICVRGPHVMQGYWNDPDETALSLRDGWLCTGDMGRFNEESGLYTLVDRKKDMIISGGYNVYPAQVEGVLFGHPSVANVSVIGVPDEKWGEAVKAVVVPSPGTTPSEAELISFAKEQVGKWLAPKSIDFTDALPLTANNKIDKRALRESYWKGRQRQIH